MNTSLSFKSLVFQRINISPEEQGIVNEDDDQTFDQNDPVAVREEWERRRRENERSHQRRPGVF